ncbi:MAG: hypothetical protein MUC59_17625 [Saprospiraceae bacterium]|nr:hypothetical protein [Saprospiraceae bacterium]
MNTTKSTVSKPKRAIPQHLIYEVSKGKPIYRKGYKEYLVGDEGLDLFRIDSTFQAWLKFRLSSSIGIQLLEKEHGLLTGPVHIQVQSSKKCVTDLAILRNEDLHLDDQVISKPPIITIDIDFRQQNSLEFVFGKIEDYHYFCVHKVIWIFTKNKKVMVAEPGQPWLTLDWSADVEVVQGLVINLEEIVSKKKG